MLQLAGSNARVTFSGPVSIDTGVTPNDGLLIESGQPFTVTLHAPTQVDVTLDILDPPPNDWNLSFQPNWLRNPIAGSQTGVTT